MAAARNQEVTVRRPLAKRMPCTAPLGLDTKTDLESWMD
jgi:hypothetical protein